MTSLNQASWQDTAATVWVEASAGSGKTYLLIQRVLRLLLAGTPVENILCVTYTKAAAAEMQQRLRRKLQEWALSNQADLVAAITTVLGRAPTVAEQQIARTLYWQVLDAPHGLAMMTLHSFAQKVLQRFPLEAAVPPFFTVIDDHMKAQLYSESLVRLYALPKDDPMMQDMQRLRRLIGKKTFYEAIEKIITEVSAVKKTTAATIEAYCGVTETPAAALARLRAEPWPNYATVLERAASKHLRNAGEACRMLTALEEANSATIEALAAKLTSKHLLNALAKNNPDLLAPLDSSVAVLNSVLETLRADEHATVLKFFTRLVDKVQDFYQSTKTARGLLDYHDLIQATQRLLAQSGAAWVHYKLDQRLDHIVLDEAQDSSVAQWDILLALAEEFYSGVSARNKPRSFLVVGDRKQSIFSFQGAAPETLDAVYQHLEQKVTAAGMSFIPDYLRQTYRCAPAIIRAVDTTFAPPALAQQVQGQKIWRGHQAYRRGAGGIVELWPCVHANNADTARCQLADTIADYLHDRLAAGSLHAGEVMIVLRRRNQLQQPLLQSLHKRGVPVAGADRLILNESLVVRDMIASARWALNPSDDLRLAQVLKSPLVGYTDADLYRCGVKRSGNLWAAVAAAAPMLQEKLAPWARWVREKNCYNFFQTLLEEQGGYSKFLTWYPQARLEPLAILLDKALEFCQNHSGAMAEFLPWFATITKSYKRELTDARDEVRILTVHGSKGLEAKMVIIGDAADVLDPPKGAFIEDGVPILPLKKDTRARAIEALLQQKYAANLAEYWRLLYVAMTRARDHLIICGSRAKKTNTGEDWHSVIETNMAGLWQEQADGRKIFLESPTSQEQDTAITAPAPTVVGLTTNSLDFLQQPLTDTNTPRLLTATATFAARQARYNTAAPDTAQRGRLLHQLLKNAGALPVGARVDFLQQHAPPAWHDEIQRALWVRDELVQDGVVLNEQPAAFKRESSAVLFAQIDVVILRADAVLIIDYKTDREATTSQARPAYLKQVQVYQQLIQQLWPAKRVRAGLLWTHSGLLEWVL